MKAMRIGLISDTHGLLRNEVYGVFEGVDEILHAGDVGDPAILTELEVIAPVRAVFGNVDGWEVREVVPETQEIERVGHLIAVVHGHQWGSPKVTDLSEAYHDFSVVVYGHTHVPLVEQSAGPLVVNPGSAGHQRFNKPVTAAILSLQRDRPPAARLIDLLA
ncbi:MAG TPA: metallophosphoesterase family protein [Gemmatimonadota bacterium]|nr:metallophosphoesterase family protein [Gemmatimonadota bacterium]